MGGDLIFKLPAFWCRKMGSQKPARLGARYVKANQNWPSDMCLEFETQFPRKVAILYRGIPGEWGLPN